MADKKEIKYWAAKPLDEIAGELVKKKTEYYRHLNDTGRAGLLTSMYRAYFKPALLRGKIPRSGTKGQRIRPNVNHLRNLIEHRLSMTTNQRPHFEPKAANTDYRSQAQVILASGLLEYYNRIKKMDRFTAKATEYGIVYGEGFVYMGWDPSRGEKFLNTDNRAIFEGDVEFASLTTFDVIRSIERRDNDEHNWVMIRRYKNRHDLAATYPELEDKILQLDPEELTDRGLTSGFLDTKKLRAHQQDQADDIPVLTFFHKPTEALPEGRIVEFAADDIVFHDGPLPYNNIPVYRIAPSEEDGQIYGYSNAFDLLPLQRMVDRLHSVIITNQSAFGVQNILIPKGSGIQMDKLRGELNAISYDGKLAPPQALNLTSTPQEIFVYVEQLVETMETLFGVNSVTRGNPENNLKSGSALALVQSMAIQFAQGLQKSYIQLLEDLGTGLVELLQEYATTPRIALIAGKANRHYMKEFKGADVDLIKRVLVDVGNPLNATVAGRMNMAELLGQQGLLQNPQQMIEVLTSGRLEPALESEQSELLFIREENETIGDGGEVRALRTDNHALHIQEHLTILHSSEARQDAEILTKTLAHIQEHEAMLAPPVPEDPNIDETQLPEQLDASRPAEKRAGQVDLPDLPGLPDNPLTGEKFNPEGGQ